MPESVTGRIFNIQRFSIHDGPGIRTTAFLKGCSLGCQWCHNPESISPQPELVFFPHKCIGCQRCFEACPTGALVLEDGQRRYRPERCRLCGRCAEACYAEALVMEGQEITAEDVVAEIRKDKPFYDNSGGGATASGGEPLVQPDFTAAIFRRCHGHGIHTCLDTAAHVPWSAFETVLPHTDLVLLDLKLMDPERHKAATGADNARILANARRLGPTGIPLVVRVPIIPGCTDDEANVAAIADFLSELPAVQRVELLPYHRFAESKYQRLGRGYGLRGTEPPPAGRLEALANLVRQRSLQVKVA
jgi:pyruvate formate lyase activating enzyme